MNNEGLWKGFNVELTKGDIDWATVMKKVREVNYKGQWITVEIPGGDRNRLKTISAQMDDIIAHY